MERLLDLFFLSVDLDLLLPRAFGERDRLLRAGERDLDRRTLVRDLDRECLRRAAERDCELRRRAGLRDLDRRFFLSGETGSLFLTGDFDLDCFLLDIDLDSERRGDDVERESFLRSVGEPGLDSCLFFISGDADREELLWLLDTILTGGSSSSSEPSEPPDPSGPAPGSWETDLDLETSRSLDELVFSFWVPHQLVQLPSWSCTLSEEPAGWELEAVAEGTGFQAPAGAETASFSPAAFPPLACSATGEGFFCLTGEEDKDLAGDELSEPPSLDSDLDLDLDLFTPAETDLDLDLRPLFLGDLDLLLPGGGECDFDRCLRDNERDFERLPDLGGERFLLAGERERLLAGDRDLDLRREGGVLDLVLLRGLLVRERRLRLSTTTERDRVRLLLRTDRERERRDLGGGDLLRRDKDRLLERLPPVRLNDRDLERPAGRLDLERERRALLTERDFERLPTAPPRLGERVLERLAPPRERDWDLRLLLGDRDRDGDLRPPRLGDRDAFLLGEGEVCRRFGEADKEPLRRLGDLDFLGDFDTFFLGVREREVDRERRITLFGDLWEGERDFL